MRATSIFRHSPWDGLLVALSLIQGAWLVGAPSMLLVALGLWWNANTVSHNFIHLPFFRSRRLNAAYAAYLTLLIGFPQALWRERHLAHHFPTGATRLADRAPRRIWTPAVLSQTALLFAVWAVIAINAPRLFLLTMVPGYALGLGLCALQGYYEHARGTTSHYGRVYNTAFFNDGFHVEHHARPGEHWTRLPRRVAGGGEASRWPPVLRWLESVPALLLDGLERVVLHSPALQRFVIGRHEAAFRACAAALPPVSRVTIIGGGLFPRTAIIVRRIFPAARITIVDSNARHVQIAREFLGADVATIAARYEPAHAAGADLVVVPLAYVGDRREFYDAPPADAVMVHDWLWRHRGERRAGARVSWLLLKRVNLVLGSRAATRVAHADVAARLSA